MLRRRTFPTDYRLQERAASFRCPRGSRVQCRVIGWLRFTARQPGAASGDQVARHRAVGNAQRGGSGRWATHIRASDAELLEFVAW